MRVMFIISGLGLGGAERQVVLLSRELVRLGHAVCICTLTRDLSRSDELAGADVELVVDQKRTRLDFGVVARLRRRMRAWRADVVHGFLYDGDLYSRLAACGLGLPVLNSERSDRYAMSRTQVVGYRATAWMCKGVVANSYAGADFARGVHRLSANRVHVVWNGVDLQEVDERLARSRRPASEIFPEANVKRISVVASIKPDKDYCLALRSFRRMLDQDAAWRMICVGDQLSDETSGYKAEVLAELNRLGLAPFVRFVGRRRDALEIIGSSDLVLVTSVREGFPNVVLEAMACGTAVVSTAYSDVRRILPDPVQVVGTRSEADIADSVAVCYERRSEIARAQRAWADLHGAASASAARMAAVYEQYVAGSTRTARSAP